MRLLCLSEGRVYSCVFTTHSSHMTTLELAITGMHCSSCARDIENRLKQKAGVLACKVSHETDREWVSFDERRLSAGGVITTIEKAGYSAVALPTRASDEVSSHYDLVILGGGSAAFAAAIRAEALGVRTLMVNDGLPIGGTCVNVGCIPSKYVVRAAEAAWRARHSPFAAVQARGAAVDYGRLIRDEQALTAAMRQKKYLDVVSDFKHLTIARGRAAFADAHTIVVDGAKRYRARKVLVATGARPHVPAIEGLEQVGYHTAHTIFSLKRQPKSMTIMGAGYVGLELAQAWTRLGTRVRIIEFTDRVLRHQTPDVSDEIARHLAAEGVELLPNVRALRFARDGAKILIHCAGPGGRTLQLEEAGIVLVATGIRPNTDGLGLERVGVELDARGHVVVDAHMRTRVPHIFAAGDVASTPAYVYTAAFEGKTAVENAFADAGTCVDYEALPWVVFTDPQVAGVGLDEQQALAHGIPHQVSKIPLSEVPGCVTTNDTRGFIKLVRHAENDRLLGARIVAAEGGELVQMLALAIRHGITVGELAGALYPYLTLSEGVKLAALAFDKDVQRLSCCAS